MWVKENSLWKYHDVARRAGRGVNITPLKLRLWGIWLFIFTRNNVENTFRLGNKVCIEILGAWCYRRPCAVCGVYEQRLPPVVVPGLPSAGRGGYFLSDQNKDKTQRKSFTSSASHLTRAGLLGTSICPNFCWRGRFCPSYLTAIFICSRISQLVPARPKC